MRKRDQHFPCPPLDLLALPLLVRAEIAMLRRDEERYVVIADHLDRASFKLGRPVIAHYQMPETHFAIRGPGDYFEAREGKPDQHDLTHLPACSYSLIVSEAYARSF